MTRQVTQDAIDLIKQWEGLRLTAYDDQGGVLTIGYGHTGPDVAPGLVVSQAQAESWLREDLDYAEHTVEETVTVPLNDSQFGALVSFVYNVGAGKAGSKDGFAVLRNGKPSSLLTAINAGASPETILTLWRQWDHVGGVVNQGLLNRRNAEIALWSRGSFVASASVQPDAPVPAWRKALMSLRTAVHSIGVSLIGGGTYAVHSVTSADPAKLQDAGQKIQQYAANYHLLVAVGVALVICGVLLDVFHKPKA